MKVNKIGKKNQFYLMLIISSVILFSYWFLLRDIKTNGVWEWFIASLFLFFIFPLVVIKFYFKENLSKFHLSLDFNKKETIIALIEGIVFVGLFTFLVLKFNWNEQFPVSKFILGDKNVLFFIDLLLFPLVVFFREFFFRGFILRATESVLGIFWAILIQLLVAIIFEILVGTPMTLVLFVLIILINLFLSLITLQTRTIFFTVIFSWIIGIVIEFSTLYYVNIVN